MAKQRKVPLTAGQDIRRAIRTFLTPGVEQFDKFIAELRKHCIVEIACKKVGLNPDIITNHYENGKAILTDPVRLSKIEYIKNLDDAVLVQALIDESDEPIPNADKPDILDMRLSFLWDQAIADRVSKLIELRDDLINEGRGLQPHSNRYRIATIRQRLCTQQADHAREYPTSVSADVAKDVRSTKRGWR